MLNLNVIVSISPMFHNNSNNNNNNNNNNKNLPKTVITRAGK